VWQERPNDEGGLVQALSVQEGQGHEDDLFGRRALPEGMEQLRGRWEVCVSARQKNGKKELICIKLKTKTA
jgi:hypothetical protein